MAEAPVSADLSLPASTKRRRKAPPSKAAAVDRPGVLPVSGPQPAPASVAEQSGAPPVAPAQPSVDDQPVKVSAREALGDLLPEKKVSAREALGDLLPDKVPPTFGTLAGIPMPKAAKPIFDFLAGFNNRLAQGLGVGVDVVDKAMRLAGVSLLEEPGSGTQAVVDAFTAMGIDARPVRTFAGEVGKEAFDNALVLSAITAAAPLAIANTAVRAPTVAQKVANDLFSTFLRSPGLGAATELGAATGAVAGRRIGGPTGEQIGALAGGVGAAAVPGAVKIGAKTLAVVSGSAVGGLLGSPLGTPGVAAGAGTGAIVTNRAIRAMSRAAARTLGKAPPRPPQSIFGAEFEGAAVSAARGVVEEDTAAAEAQITNILNSLPSRSVDESNIALRAGLDKALRIARARVSAAFSQGFLEEKTTAEPLIEAAKAMRKATSSASPTTPSAEIARILKEFTKTQKVGKKSIRVPREVTGEQLQQFRTDLLTAKIAAQAGPAPNRPLNRNLTILLEAVDETMAKIDEEAVVKAQQLSRRMQELFFRGPMGRVMARSTAGESIRPEERTVQTLLSRPRSFRQVEEIAREFNQPGLVPATREAVRAIFKAEAERGGVAVEAFMRKNKSALESLSGEFVTLQHLADELASAQAKKMGAQKGALANFAAQDPEVAVKRIFSSANPAETAATIRARISKDPEALAGFEHDVLAETFRRAGYSALSLQELMAGGRVRRMLEASLSPEKMARLKTVVEAVAKAEKGEGNIPEVAGPVAKPVFDLAARFTGSSVGRKVGGLFGGATIQQTAVTTSFAKWFARRLTGKIDPSDAFAMAVTDPKFEQIVMMSIPTTPEEVQRFNKALRVLLSAEAATRTDETEKESVAP